MANYCCVTRSSYFYVTDEEKYKELMTHVIDNGCLDFWDEEKENGKIAHAFGGYCQILGCIDDLEAYNNGESEESPDYDYFLQKLSKIIAPNSACVIFQAGSEKLGYIDGFVDVVMHNKVKCESLESIARDILEKNDICPDSIEMFY